PRKRGDNMNVKAVTIILSVMFLVYIVDLVRREKLTFKYASGWILLIVLAIFAAIFDGLVFRLSELLGFQLPSNFIFFSVLCGFVFVSLLLTIFLCQQSNRNERMAQKIGILEHEIEQIKKQKTDDR
ncbi:MAG: DUF2304 domain-containing protein, partial [Candidatus Omnitrophica bacterium]|nr:DUF2304 domain-containing protein [Candidatus Omnitrophota bacterium]